MRIVKLNEDKIRITLNLEDLKENNIDLHDFMSNSIESQELFVHMLNKAKQEVGFVTDDYKIMIEALATSDGNFVLTVTRINPISTTKKKKIHIKRKSQKINLETTIYCFSTFDEFCDFCIYLKHSKFNNFSKFVDTISLFLYNEHYYLVLKNIHSDFALLKNFCSSITEFGHFVNNSHLFEHKLLEYGDIILPEDAILKCQQYFVTTKKKTRKKS
mgnify:CR=1 FL=1